MVFILKFIVRRNKILFIKCSIGIWLMVKERVIFINFVIGMFVEICVVFGLVSY